MANEPPSQRANAPQRQLEAQQQQRSSEQTQDQTRGIEQLSTSAEDFPLNISSQSKADQKSAFKAEAAIVTLGRAKEKNIQVKWIDVPLGNSISCRFEIRTAGGNALEATIEQRAYRQTYSGSGAINTQPVPVAPVGTKGKLIVRDTTTGESFEQPWTWYAMGGGSRLSLWEAIKRLFWKSKA
jgi:hypothetical protein